MSNLYEVIIPDFFGKRQLLVLCYDDVQVLRSIDGVYYPLTDESGEDVILESKDGHNVVFNSTVTNDSRACSYKLQSTAPIEAVIRS